MYSRSRHFISLTAALAILTASSTAISAIGGRTPVEQCLLVLERIQREPINRGKKLGLSRNEAIGILDGKDLDRKVDYMTLVKLHKWMYRVPDEFYDDLASSIRLIRSDREAHATIKQKTGHALQSIVSWLVTPKPTTPNNEADYQNIALRSLRQTLSNYEQPLSKDQKAVVLDTISFVDKKYTRGPITGSVLKEKLREALIARMAKIRDSYLAQEEVEKARLDAEQAKIDLQRQRTKERKQRRTDKREKNWAKPLETPEQRQARLERARQNLLTREEAKKAKTAVPIKNTVKTNTKLEKSEYAKLITDNSLSPATAKRFHKWLFDQESRVQQEVMEMIQQMANGADIRNIPKLFSTTKTGIYKFKPSGTDIRVLIMSGAGGFRIISAGNALKNDPQAKSRKIISASEQRGNFLRAQKKQRAEEDKNK